jgi:hypothetical protein
LQISSLQETPGSRLSRGYLICFSATVLWSLTGIFIRYLTEEYQIPPLVLAFWRDLIVALTLAVALFILSPKHLQFSASTSSLYLLMVSSCRFQFLVDGVGRPEWGAVSTVLATARQPLRLSWDGGCSRKAWVGEDAAVVLSLLGCLLVSGAYDLALWQLNPVGIMRSALGTGVAAYNLFGRTSANRGIFPGLHSCTPFRSPRFHPGIQPAGRLAPRRVALAAPGRASSRLLWQKAR